MNRKVENLYAWIVEDKDGDECVVAAYREEPDGEIVASTLMGADLANLTEPATPGGTSGRDIARTCAANENKPVRLIRCGRPEVLEVIEP